MDSEAYDDDDIDQVFQFGQDRMKLPGVDLSCCEFPETTDDQQQVTACGIEIDDDYKDE